MTQPVTINIARAAQSFFRPSDERRRGRDPADGDGTPPPPTARAVLIDMEPKVVHASLRKAKRSGQWQYNARYALPDIARARHIIGCHLTHERGFKRR